MKPVYKAVLCVAMSLLLSGASMPGSRETRYLRMAKKAFDLENYTLALELYNQVLQVNPGSLKANYMAGYCYLELHAPKKAKVYLKRAFDISPIFSEPLVFLYLAQAHHQYYEFEKAKQYYLQEINRTPRTDWLYIRFLQKKIDECAAGAVLVNKPSVAEVINMGVGINTLYSDYIPVFMQDDSTMLLTTWFEYSDKHGFLTSEEKLKYAKLGVNGWQSMVLESFVAYTNKAGHGLVNISASGSKLYTFHKTKGLHSSQLEQGVWTDPQQLNYPFNEGQRNVSAFITADEKYAFFSSDRPGGLGGLDLYVAARQENGAWGTALNLGPSINTAYDDDAPFLDPDTHTLYFSSLGHNTMGGFDIFSSKLENGDWGAAQNLGYPINSTHDDIYFVLNRNRTSAFLSSNRAGGFGGKDIYQVILPSN